MIALARSQWVSQGQRENNAVVVLDGFVAWDRDHLLLQMVVNVYLEEAFCDPSRVYCST